MGAPYPHQTARRLIFYPIQIALGRFYARPACRQCHEVCGAWRPGRMLEKWAPACDPVGSDGAAWRRRPSHRTQRHPPPSSRLSPWPPSAGTGRTRLSSIGGAIRSCGYLNSAWAPTIQSFLLPWESAADLGHLFVDGGNSSRTHVYSGLTSTAPFCFRAIESRPSTAINLVR